MQLPQDAPGALAPAQLKAALWADARLQVHAVVMGASIPDLSGRLAASGEGLRAECLLPGVIEATRHREAPQLLTLAPASPFSDWLLFEAANGLGAWGVLVLSAQPRLLLRQHLRQLLRARLPQGPLIDLAWMDPELLARLLPTLEPSVCQEFFGPIHSFVVPAAGEWCRFEAPLGVLRVTRQARLG